jgi:glycosyltransferase involved in cell wall biosynthesis
MKKGRLKISAIIPAYNEEGRISRVLEAVTSSPLLDEIVVVDDGSTDRTYEEARSFPVKVIKREKNGGKGAALKTGLQNTKADIYVFLDADLLGLTPEHIQKLIEPLLKDEKVMMTVGKFVGGRTSTDLSQVIVPYISGQRAIRKEFFKDLPEIEDKGFGVEVIFTKHALKKGYKTKEVILEKAAQIMKEEKRGIAAGVLSRAVMYWEMLKSLFKSH